MSFDLWNAYGEANDKHYSASPTQHVQKPIESRAFLVSIDENSPADFVFVELSHIFSV